MRNINRNIDKCTVSHIKIIIQFHRHSVPYPTQSVKISIQDESLLIMKRKGAQVHLNVLNCRHLHLSFSDNEFRIQMFWIHYFPNLIRTVRF
jgi:hypothetical protein